MTNQMVDECLIWKAPYLKEIAVVAHSTASTKLPITPKAATATPANALSLLTRENEDLGFRQAHSFVAKIKSF